MKKRDYRTLSANARLRGNPENIALEKEFSDELASLSYSDILTYIRIAMNGVEAEYTQKSKEAGEKVKTHLSSVLTDVVYEYQGSVMTNTHIRGNSDIDLLVISTKFYHWDSDGINDILSNNNIRQNKFLASQIKKLEAVVNSPSYEGDGLGDLKQNRTDSEKKMEEVYSTCDITHAKAIKIRNLSLKRDVDIVIASSYKDANTIIDESENNKGIKVYNKTDNTVGKADFPFLSIERINQRSTATKGRLKKMIRFLKTVKADSEHEIKLSSFDINAICYNIDVRKYITLSFYELIPVIYNQLYRICTDKVYADSIISVDGREPIFKDNPSKLTNLQLILNEIQGLYLDLRNNTNLNLP